MRSTTGRRAGLDLSAVLHQPDVSADVGRHCTQVQDHGLDKALDNELIRRSQAALDDQTPVAFELPIRNVNRTVGTMLGYELTSRWGGAGLPDDTIRITFRGSAGQSFAAFVPPGISMRIIGDANDYFGKGLSGGKLVIHPSEQSTFVAEENIIIGKRCPIRRHSRGGVRSRGSPGNAFAFETAARTPW